MHAAAAALRNCYMLCALHRDRDEVEAFARRPPPR